MAKVSVLLGNGDGTFTAHVDNAVRGAPHGWEMGQPALGDLNGDGHGDLVLPFEGKPAIAVLLGDGDGAFTCSLLFAGPPSTSALALGDLDGDHRLDLVTSDRTGVVRVFMNVSL